MKVLLIESQSCFLGLSPGLAYLASSLKHAGHEVYGISLTNHRSYDPNSLQRYFVEKVKPDLIGYSIYYISEFSFKDNLEDLKKYYHGPVVVGGPQLNIAKEKILVDYPLVDFAIVGEAEKSAIALCDYLNGNRIIQSIDGLIYRDNGKVLTNEPCKPNFELDQLPFPDYTVFGVKEIHTYSLCSSRGCPFRCTFCNRNSDVWRARSPENMIAELLHARKTYNIKQFCLNDDSFNVRPGRIVKFCNMLIQEGITIPWFCSGARADKLEDEMLNIMSKSGCHSLSVGVETLQPSIFEKINKGETIDQIKNGIKIAKSHGFNVNGYFMIGLPGDTPKGVWDTYRQAQGLGLDRLGFSILLPFPNTKLYSEINDIPGVKWLKDYREVSTAWTYDSKWSKIETSFELPYFSAMKKIDLFHRIRTKQGDPRPPYHKYKIIFGFYAILYILRYDFFHAPVTLFKMSKDVFFRLLDSRGKTVSKIIVGYRDDYLPKGKVLNGKHDLKIGNKES